MPVCHACCFFYLFFILPAGLLVPDIPLEETPEIRKVAEQHGLELVLLTTPTTPQVCGKPLYERPAVGSQSARLRGRGLADAGLAAGGCGHGGRGLGLPAASGASSCALRNSTLAWRARQLLPPGPAAPELLPGPPCMPSLPRLSWVPAGAHAQDCAEQPGLCLPRVRHWWVLLLQQCTQGRLVRVPMRAGAAALSCVPPTRAGGCLAALHKVRACTPPVRQCPAAVDQAAPCAALAGVTGARVNMETRVEALIKQLQQVGGAWLPRLPPSAPGAQAGCRRVLSRAAAAHAPAAPISCTFSTFVSVVILHFLFLQVTDKAVCVGFGVSGPEQVGAGWGGCIGNVAAASCPLGCCNCDPDATLQPEQHDALPSLLPWVGAPV